MISESRKPNAFVAVKIPSTEIRCKIDWLQGALVAKDCGLQQAIVSTARNHVTLMVMRLDSTADIEKYVIQSVHMHVYRSCV